MELCRKGSHRALGGIGWGLMGSHGREGGKGRGAYSVSHARAASPPGRQQSAGSGPASGASACYARSGLVRGEGVKVGTVRVELHPTSGAPFPPLGSAGVGS